MIFAAALLVAVLSAESPAVQSSDQHVRVILADCTDSKPVAGATVSILSRSGRVLGKGVTDGNGQVDLQRPSEQEDPAFVLAEHPRFFIGGVRWDPAFSERFISMAWLGGL